MSAPSFHFEPNEAAMLDAKTEREIVIVGAGPTGLASAVELNRRGLDPLIIDQQEAGANTSRACVVSCLVRISPVLIDRCLSR